MRSLSVGLAVLRSSSGQPRTEPAWQPGRHRTSKNHSLGVWNGSWKSMVFKKKIYRYRPGLEPTIEVRTTQNRTQARPL